MWIRLKASLLHFLISVIIISIAFYWILTQWFPYPHFWISGGIQGLSIVIPVDFVMGPILMFVIYNIKKKKTELIRDIAIIAILQLSVLIYGLNKVYSQRISVESLLYTGTIGVPSLDELRELNPEFDLNSFRKSFSIGYRPILAYVERPSLMPKVTSLQELFSPSTLFNVKKKPKEYYVLLNMQRVEEDIFASIGAEFKYSLYRSLQNARVMNKVLALSSQSLTKLYENDEYKQEINRFIFEEANRTSDDFMFFEIKAKYGSAIKVLDKNAKPVTYLNVKRYNY